MNKFDLLFLIIIVIIIIIYKYNSYYDLHYIEKIYNTKFEFNRYNYKYYNKLKLLYYYPWSNYNFIKLLNKLKINENDCFLDIGSGDGLVLLYVNKIYNFKKIIGIELDNNIYLKSLYNINKVKSNKIRIININVIDYEIPNYINFIYLFNPFNIEVYYNKLIKNINNSFYSKKRDITIILINIGNEILKLFYKNKFIIINYQKIYNFNCYILKL